MDGNNSEETGHHGHNPLLINKLRRFYGKQYFFFLYYMGFFCMCVCMYVCHYHMLFLCILLLQNKLLVTFCESLLVSKYKQILISLHGKELETPSVLPCLLDIFLMYTRNPIKHQDLRKPP